MVELVVRNLDDDVKVRLRRRARRHGHSTKDEARDILRNAVKDESTSRKPLGSRLRERFAGIGLEDELPELRSEVAQPGIRRESGRRSSGTIGRWP